MAKADIEAVKAAHPILDVLRDLGIAVQHGRFRCLRPENHSHGDRTPSVSVWPDKGAFKCWVCPDVKGDVIDLVRLARNCSFMEALRFLGATPYAGRSTGQAAGPAPGRDAPPAMVRPLERSVPPHPGPPPAFDAHGQPALFPETGTSAANAANAGTARAPAAPAPTAPSPTAPRPPASRPTVSPKLPSDSGTRVPSEAEEAEETALRQSILGALLEACAPVGGAAGRYLAKRRIFKRTWDAQRLRMIDDYAGISRRLEAAFGLDDLARMGFFNAAGHLRFYRHILLFPYYDVTGRAAYMQARAIDPDAKPKELSLSGHIPMPYNARLLDGEPGQVFLCEGVIDTLTLLEQGFPAVGVPGAANFKAAWAPLFRNKVVHVAFDPDGPGESGAAKAIERLQAMGIEARRLTPPTGKDLNEWFRRG